MSRIVILDTRVEEKQLKTGYFKYFNVLNEKAREDKKLFCTHGTVCALMLDHLTQEYELVNIQIMEDSPAGYGKPMGYIGDLKKGLELCMDLKADIICMSAVTSVLSDSKALYHITKMLSERSIIVSALDNKGYVTVPSSYPFVIGVQSDREDILEPGEIIYWKDNWLHSDIYANCHFDWLKKYGCTPSNSLAVPVVAAKLNDWLNRGEDVLKMLKLTAKQNRKPEKTDPPIVEKVSVPVVAVYNRSGKEAYSVCIRMMDYLHKKYHVQASCLSMEETDYDIRAKKLLSVEKDIPRMQRYYRTDLIFLALDTESYRDVENLADIDLFICMNKEGDLFSAFYEGKSITEKREKLPDTIYQILTE